MRHYVILSVAKDLLWKREQILRFAQNDMNDLGWRQAVPSAASTEEHAQAPLTPPSALRRPSAAEVAHIGTIRDRLERVDFLRRQDPYAFRLQSLYRLINVFDAEDDNRVRRRLFDEGIHIFDVDVLVPERL